MIVLVLSVAYILKLLHKCFYGQIQECWRSLRDISTHEFVILASLSAVIIFFGIYPMGIVDMISPVVETIIESVGI